MLKSVEEFLKREGVPYTIFQHPLAYTAQEEAAVSHVPGRCWAKVVICIADGTPVQAVLPAHLVVDLAQLRVLAGAETMRLAREDEVAALYPEYERGAMPPFGRLSGHRVFVDRSLVGEPEMVFNAGTHTDALCMQYENFAEISKPVVGAFGLSPVRGPVRSEGSPAMGPTLLRKTDAQLRDAVYHQLEWEPEINASAIGVTASDGVITLTGLVNSYPQKIAAERAAMRVHGVRVLANDLHVNLRDEYSDPEIAKDALQALQSHTSIPNELKVTVREGFLTLEGTVAWMYQKLAAESAVKYLKGVKGVSNLIHIKPTVSTGEVKTKIEEALRRSAEVDAGRILVEAESSTITLSGNVRSWAERQEAERAAWAAPGVTRVENHIVVTP